MQSVHELTTMLSVANHQIIPSIEDLLMRVVLHVGEYKWSCRTTDFEGWLVCDGRSVHRETYEQLFNIIGTIFGSDDELTFKIPDLRGKVMAAIGHGPDLSNRVMGDEIGDETHTLTVNELPGHTHTGTTNTAGAHTHGGLTGSAGSHTHTTNAIGGSIGLAVADGTNTVTSTDSSGNELNVWTTPRTLTVNAAPDHTHSISSDGNHTHTFTTQSTGLGLAHNIMQPTSFCGNVFIYSGVR